MLFQIGLFSEPMLTDRTTVRPGAIVCVHVTSEIARSGETLLALTTLMWFILNEEK